MCREQKDRFSRQRKPVLFQLLPAALRSLPGEQVHNTAVPKEGQGGQCQLHPLLAPTAMPAVPGPWLPSTTSGPQLGVRAWRAWGAL